MKSDVIEVFNSGEGMREALRQTEAAAVFKGLDHKAALHLRLLAEEMMGMLCQMVGEVRADFWLEDVRRTFRLHLRTDTQMDPEKREDLLSVSTSGRNAAAKGIMGKIRDIFERANENCCVDGVYDDWCLDSDIDYCGMPLIGFTAGWSLNQYRINLPRNRREEWDELEKSIVANLADEVEIYIEGRSVELVIYKKF